MAKLTIRRRCLLPVTAVLVAIAGCGARDDVPKETQVAVRVNSGEISTHQLQAVLRRQTLSMPSMSDGAAAEVLDRLIDQELAAQAATAAGMHKAPDVIQALELQRREVLARAYHDRIADAATGPSSDEIDRYYDANPALFAQRRLYLISEVAVEASPDEVAALTAALSRVRGADEVQAAIDRLRLNSSARQYAQSAEDVPLSLLPAFALAKPGDSVVVAQSGGARIFTINLAHLAPVDRRTAAPAIARYLLSERQRSLVGDAMSELRKGAKLQYSAGFARPGAASAPVPGASQPRTR